MNRTLGARLREARSEFIDAYHEREALLRHDLVGDTDIEALRVERRSRTAPPGRPAHHDATEDDDGDLPYSFF